MPRPLLWFESDAIPDQSFYVSRVEGQEGISRPYRFELDFVSPDPHLDLGQILRKPARLGIERGRRNGETEILYLPPLPIHGRVASLERTEGEKASLYRAVLVPTFWKLSLSYQSRIFLGKTVPEILRQVLEANELRNFEFQLRKTYPAREYVVQYEETDLDFVSRWLEHEGIFYFFVQGEKQDRVIFADDKDVCAPIGEKDPLRLRPDPTLDWFGEEAIQSITVRQEPIPRSLALQDYNWRIPALDLRCEKEVNPEGEGIVYEYNNHYKTKEEGLALAAVRVEEIRCREKTFTGSGTCRSFRTGVVFEFANELSAPTRLLLTEVRHQATQTAAFDAEYRNDFVAIPADRVFRPKRSTPWPAIQGAMHARVDSAGSGEYADVDEEGRYKVKLPLDPSEKAEGQASRWIRMAQPYAGADHGMHFPLHKGTEVLLTHIDGDPDRPIITGAVPNAESSSIVHGNNHTRSGIQTAGGNQIAMEDEAGHQRILLKSGSGKSHLVVGSGSVDRADLTSVFTSGWGHAGYVFGSTGWTTGMGAMKVDLTAGYPLLQAAVGTVKLACEAGAAMLGKQAKEAGWPAAAAMIVPPLVGVGGTMIVNKLFSKLVKSKIQAAVVKKIKTLPEDNTPWYKIHQHVYKAVKNQWDYMMGVSTTGLGAYLIRGEGGSRLQLTRGGESILIGTEKGQVIVYGGQNVWITSPEGVQMNADFFLNLYTKKGSISLTELGLALNYEKQAFLLEEDKITLQSNQKILLGSGHGTVGDKGRGKEAFVRIIDDRILQEVLVSAREQIELHTSKGTVKCTEEHIELAFGENAKVTLKNGEIELKAKKVSLLADDIVIGNAAQSDLVVSGKSIALSSQQATTIRGQTGVRVNNQQFAP